MRGALLATAATFLGCALFFTLPDLIASQLNRTMPYWFYESEVRTWPVPVHVQAKVTPMPGIHVPPRCTCSM
jgi:hypothetical protein